MIRRPDGTLRLPSLMEREKAMGFPRVKRHEPEADDGGGVQPGRMHDWQLFQCLCHYPPDG